MRSNGKMSLSSAIVCLCCIILTVQAAKKNYCKPDLCHGVAHVACLNESLRLYKDECNSNAEVIKLRKRDKNHILESINKLRNYVAQGNLKGFNTASNMSSVNWDAELAYIAEMNVRVCAHHRDACRNTDKHKNVGQTTAYGGVKGKTRTPRRFIRGHIKAWFSQWKLATMKDILSYNSKEDAPPHNFLQIVHDKVQKIGCACLKQSKNGWIQNFFTCNYDEAPIKGQEVYKTGIPGAQCVSGKNHNFTSLCGEVDLGDVDRDQPEPNNQTQTTQVDHQNKPDNQTEAPQVDPQNKPDNQTRILSRTIAATNAIIGTIEIRPSMTSLEDLQLNRTIERGIEKEAKERRERFHRFLAEIEKTERKTNNRKIQIFTWNHQVDISIKPEDE